MPKATYAHQSPTSVVLLDVSPNSVAMELQLPVPELELAFGQGVIKDPETLIERFGPQLKEYLKAHIHAYVTTGNPWQVEIESLRMDKGKYIESDNVYWEVIAHVVLTPQAGETTRAFVLDYDVIMHQVINHAAFVSIRNDWEAGVNAEHPVEVGVIHIDGESNTILPLKINLASGSQWNGFKSMVSLGIKHIAEGTDHLLFLLALLLSAPLLAARGRWNGHGSIRYSITRLIKIITAFTIGHSLTLLIGAVGLLRLPRQPVEILIAISILISAIHALRPIFPGREAYVAVGFGLIHGLAFAGTLEDLNLAPMQMALSILGFNIGIELMQLFVILLFVPWLLILSRSKYYSVVRIAGALFAMVAALAWITERSINKGNVITEVVEKISHHSLWLLGCLAGLAMVSLLMRKYNPNTME